MSVIRSFYIVLSLAHLGAAIAAIVVLLASDYFDKAVVVAGISRNGTGLPDGSDTFRVVWNSRIAWFVFIQSTLSAMYHAFIATVGWNVFARTELGDLGRKESGYPSRLRAFSWAHHAVTRIVMVSCIFGLAGVRELSSLVFAGAIIALGSFTWLNVEYGFFGLKRARGGVFDWRTGPIMHIACAATLVALGAHAAPYFWNIIQLTTAGGIADRSILRWALLLGVAGLEILLSVFSMIDIWQVSPFRGSSENCVFATVRLFLTYASEATFVAIAFALSAY